MIKTHGTWFKDEHNRTRILRGANLSGSTKVPFSPDGATYRSDNFYDHRNVSFVGRPFPLDEADEHLSRLRAWGMTFLRFLITWEAIEHAGPGQYDEAYLDYVYQVVKKAADYGINVFIDPHQDVWSRWTGGDGAPGWTLEAVGFDLTKLHKTGAAISHQTHGDPFPRMIWPTNYSKLGAGTMFTLFFGGDDFAPHFKIDGVPAQEYLQSHYLNAIKQVVMRLKDLPNVVGYDSLNEPGSGFIGVSDLAQINEGLLVMGTSPTPYQAMLLGAGYPQEVNSYQMGFTGPEVMGSETVNAGGLSVWRQGYDCIWKQEGIWTNEGGQPRLLRPDHFARKPDGSAINTADDYLKPFIKRFIAEIRAIDPKALLFLEGVPNGGHPSWSAEDAPQAVNAGHWYDILTLITKQFNPEFTVDSATRQFVQGADAVAQTFTNQLAAIKNSSADHMGSIPTLIGEFGIPFDLDEKSAYQSGNFSSHIHALDLYYDAMDANLLNCTIWNYTADNSNGRGDLWNDEDLSIFSRDQQDKDWREDIHAGGRGLPAIVRPYAWATAGEPLRMSFDLETRIFEFEFRHDPTANAPTEIFVPNFQYPNGYTVELSDGTYRTEGDTLIIEHTAEQAVHTVKVIPK
ncbi:MAG: cellulase family glycosylhydrolase [Anaerolineae bacterium]|nr:cellulase family glycosylhydrolase [Anaerolineae bacterium]